MQNLGLYEQSVKYFYRTLSLDPFELRVYGLSATFLMRLGKLEEAAAQLRRGAEIEPNYPTQYFGQAHLAILMKKYDRADTLIAKAEKISRGATTEYKALLLAARGEKEKALALSQEPEIYALLGMKEETIQRLKDRAGSKQSYYLLLLHYPVFANYRNDPQFIAIVAVEKKKYEENTRKYGDLGME
jgi:tetratricopeptide (TPR) repeat protein